MDLARVILLALALAAALLALPAPWWMRLTSWTVLVACVVSVVYGLWRS